MQPADRRATPSEAASTPRLNLLFYPVKNVMLGGELLWGRRENNNGNSGDDTRFQFSAKYSF